eukprot:TRINITY_DN880_c0_g1_i1.p1 TRINITY_DN880_c0_g1~~TRINITY_DN880_c0_g1_i1.p1  ORF type:complete len:473 (+),score=82.98 TRINITY_DN880_c0_g1_i1:1849-3267(+)
MEYLSFATDLLYKEIVSHPLHVAMEILFGVIIVYFLSSRPYTPQPGSEKLSEKEEEELIQDWKPATLIPDVIHDTIGPTPAVLSGLAAGSVTIDGKRYENFSSCNFLGLSTAPEVVEAATNAIDVYGVGSCGPRGFYGTIKPHLDLEKRLAKFFGTERAIIYSYSYSTISSIIPAFAARGDRVLYDAGVNQCIQTGVKLARCDARPFKHNDVADLRKLVESFVAKDERLPRAKKNNMRKFIVLEGLYKDFGDIAALPEIAEIASKYKYRLVIDDSLGVGVLGKTGRGVVEHFGLDMQIVDLYIGALCYSFGGVGGFCVGGTIGVEHQRLSSTGYCFSASLPAFLSVAALKAIDLLESHPEQLAALRDNVRLAAKLLGEQSKLKVFHEDPAPMFHLRVPSDSQLTFKQKEEFLQKICDSVLAQGFAICRSAYNGTESVVPEPSIRFSLSSHHDEKSIKAVVSAITTAATTATI